MLQKLQLQYVEPGTFCGLSQLEKLDMRFNKLNKVPELAPVKLTLVKLFLSHNQISRFPGHYFQGFVKLCSLNIDNNHLEAVPILGWLTKALQILSLRENHITSIEGFGTQNRFRKLHSINLDANKLNVFDVKILSSMPKLTYIYLQNNFITHIENYSPYFSHSISLFENPFHYDTRMAWITSLKNDYLRSPICATPWCLKGRKMSKMSKYLYWKLYVTAENYST